MSGVKGVSDDGLDQAGGDQARPVRAAGAARVEARCCTATAAAQRTFAARSGCRTALTHADTVVEGAILKVIYEGATHWVVFSGGNPVTAYPTSPVALDDLVAHADVSKKVTPDQYRAKQADASRKRKALDTARSFGSQVRRRRERW